MIIDYRCPSCNLPVRGKQTTTVTSKPPTKPPTACQHCKAPIEGRKFREDLGEEFGFWPRATQGVAPHMPHCG